ncbi:MAG: helicase HerA-like domain-containing protein [Sphingomonadaceae bacterium]
MSEGILIGGADGTPQTLLLRRANRHGLIAGATGTGKTVTLQVLAEGFSRAGVPVFAADMKGDLSGMAMPGSPMAKTDEPFRKRAAELGLSDWAYAPSPVVFWDLFGQQGHPIRTTVSEMGPLLLARLMGLTEAQEGVLSIAFRVADEEGLLLLDLKDLQALLSNLAERASELTAKYGNVTKQSVGAIQRQLLQLDSQGGSQFFGEPALDIADFMRVDEAGQGQVNILMADRLMASPRLYATFLLWLMSELFEELPEVGEPDKPKLVFFFDEAHLLFSEAPPALLDRIETVVRLIRSKGVGIYFVTQNPIDIPERVAAQLGNRVQHALRAFTPKEARAVKAASETFRPNPKVDVASAITELRVGEALVSVLDEKGTPTPVERTLVAPPRGRAGPLTPAERTAIIAASDLGERYAQTVDRESAYEVLAARAEEAAARVQAEKEAAERAKAEAKAAAERAREEARRAREAAKPTMAEKAVESAARSVASSMGRQIANSLGRSLLRGLFGGLKR